MPRPKATLVVTDEQRQTLESMAAPGAQPTAENSPVSYKLRQDIRKYREEVGRAERRLRDLEVEASLAGVPPEWQKAPEHTDAAPGS